MKIDACLFVVLRSNDFYRKTTNRPASLFSVRLVFPQSRDHLDHLTAGPPDRWTLTCLRPSPAPTRMEPSRLQQQQDRGSCLNQSGTEDDEMFILHSELKPSVVLRDICWD
ncbi:unnamed protein product [Pleuronectes platessa]|uniref:Uncharacterized protein n=1 Tax=Pleuronectes platessa TaxID=8262 RepID=A0A9N7VQN5_PLEPL|nr:unnamed protein product [Pleuronectes platessa]